MDKERKVKLSIAVTAYEPYVVHDAETGEFLGYANHHGELVCGKRMIRDELDQPQRLNIVEWEDEC